MMDQTPRHFAPEAANAVWVVKNGWRIYPALRAQDNEVTRAANRNQAAVCKVQFRGGQTELVYTRTVFTSYEAAREWVNQTWTLEDADAEEEWVRDGEVGWGCVGDED